MAFQIHEDTQVQRRVLRNFKNEPLQNFGCAKKNCEPREVLTQLQNGIKHDSKRIKLAAETAKDKENEKKQEKVVPREEKLSVEDLVLEEEDVSSKEREKDAFPDTLSHLDEYRMDILRYLSETEKTCPRIKPAYMLKQSDISWSTRSVLVDWLGSVATEYKFSEQTFHLSVNYIDRFLSQFSVVRSKFQLVGAAAMMLAAKIEEIYPIGTNEWSYLTGDTFSVRQIHKMEQLILKVLKFVMQPPTIYSFVEILSMEFNLDEKTKHLAMYLSELVLMEGDEYLKHLPSKLAASSIALARHTLSPQEPVWPEPLKKVSGYSLQQLSPVVQKQQKTFIDSPHKEQQAIQQKYRSEKYSRVALLRPRNLYLDDMDEE